MQICTEFNILPHDIWWKYCPSMIKYWANYIPIIFYCSNIFQINSLYACLLGGLQRPLLCYSSTRFRRWKTRGNLKYKNIINFVCKNTLNFFWNCVFPITPYGYFQHSEKQPGFYNSGCVGKQTFSVLKRLLIPRYPYCLFLHLSFLSSV